MRIKTGAPIDTWKCNFPPYLRKLWQTDRPITNQQMTDMRVHGDVTNSMKQFLSSHSKKVHLVRETEMYFYQLCVRLEISCAFHPLLLRLQLSPPPSLRPGLFIHPPPPPPSPEIPRRHDMHFIWFRFTQSFFFSPRESLGEQRREFKKKKKDLKYCFILGW